MLFLKVQALFLVVISLIVGILGKGNLLVGFMRYTNSYNTTSGGGCCGGTKTPPCVEPCQLILVATVTGIDVDGNNTRTPSKSAVTLLSENEFRFPSSSNNFKSPLTFPFYEWPGSANITVQMFDRAVAEDNLVDTFVFQFNKNVASLNFTEQSQQRGNSNIELSMIFRYDCAKPYKGSGCNINCKETPDLCITTETPTDWTKTTTDSTSIPSSTACSFTKKPNSPDNGNTICVDLSADTTTVDMTTLHTESTTREIILTILPTTTETSTVIQSTSVPTTSTTLQSEHTTTTTTTTTTTSPTEETTTTVVTSTKTTEYDHYTSTSQTTTQKPTNDFSTETLTTVPLTTVSTIPVQETEHTSTPGHITTTVNPPTAEPVVTSENVVTQHPVERSTEPTGGHTSPPGPTIIKEGGAMQYWPIIVGSILGALAIVAVVIFLVYYKKQKALIKRQEIYNVTPRKWNLEPHRENGMSNGKSEIALETEEV